MSKLTKSYAFGRTTCAICLDTMDRLDVRTREGQRKALKVDIKMPLFGVKDEVVVPAGEHTVHRTCLDDFYNADVKYYDGSEWNRVRCKDYCKPQRSQD